MYHMKPGEKEELIKRLHFYYNQHMSGINRRKEMLAIIVLLEHSGMKISKTAQTGQDYEVASSQKSAIIYNDGAPKNNKNAAGPHDMSGSPEIRGPHGKKLNWSTIRQIIKMSHWVPGQKTAVML